MINYHLEARRVRAAFGLISQCRFLVGEEDACLQDVRYGEVLCRTVDGFLMNIDSHNGYEFYSMATNQYGEGESKATFWLEGHEIELSPETGRAFCRALFLMGHDVPEMQITGTERIELQREFTEKHPAELWPTQWRGIT